MPVRPSALTTEAAGQTRSLRRLGMQVAKAEIIYVGGPKLMV